MTHKGWRALLEAHWARGRVSPHAHFMKRMKAWEHHDAANGMTRQGRSR